MDRGRNRTIWACACGVLLSMLTAGCATATMPNGNKVKVYPPYEIKPDGAIAPNERCWQITMDAAVKAGPETARIVTDTILKAAAQQPNP